VNVNPDFDVGRFARGLFSRMAGAVDPACGSLGLKLIDMVVLPRESGGRRMGSLAKT
jgi:hypothetical protein